MDLNDNAAALVKPPVTTNVLHFTFACKRQGGDAGGGGGGDGGGASASATGGGGGGGAVTVTAADLLPVPVVRPQSYRQGVLVLDGRRHMIQAKAEANATKSGLANYFPADL